MARAKEELTEEEIVRKAYDWFDQDRQAKSHIQDEFEEANKIYNCKHWELKDPTGRPLRTANQMRNRPNSVENFTQSLIEGLVAEFTEDVDLIDYPREPGNDDTALVLTHLKKYIMEKNSIKTSKVVFIRNFFLYGTGIWHAYWDPSWRGGRGPNRWIGEIRWESAHPQAIYPDLRCRTSIEDGMRIHKAVYRAREYVEEKFDADLSGEAMASADMVLDEEDHPKSYDEESNEVLLVETWYKGRPLVGKDEGYGLHVMWWAGESSPTYLHHESYVYYEPGEECKYPFFFRTRYPRENSVWGFGEGYFLKSPQIALNKTSELILEAHMHNALGQTFYNENALTQKQQRLLKKYGMLPNMYFPVNNIEMIKRERGHGVDASLPADAGRIQRAMEAIIGRHDISQGRTPGSVVAFRALDLLAARAKIRLRSAENSILSSYEEVGDFVNNLIYQYYTERRAYRIIGDHSEKVDHVIVNQETGEESPFVGHIPPGWELDVRESSAIEYGTFDLDMHKKIYVYDEQSGIGEVFPYDEGFMEAILETEQGIEEGEEFDDTTNYEIYCPEMDVKCKASTAMPTDRMFYLEMGKELFMGEMIDEETFWYILNNGKFPPFDTIMKKRNAKMAAMAKHEKELHEMQAEQGGPEGGMPPEGMPPAGAEAATPQHEGAVVEQILRDRPDLMEKFRQLPPEAQDQLLADVQAGELYY